MARLWSSGFELNSLTSGMELQSVNNTGVTTTTAQADGGTYSIRINPSASVQNINFATTNTSPTTTFVRFSIYITTFPAAAVAMARGDFTFIPWTIRSSGSGIRLHNGSNTQIGSDVSLSTGAWHTIEVKCTLAAGAGGTLALRVDNSQTISDTTTTTSNTFSNALQFGSTVSATADYYIDNVALNDTSGSFQTSYPGPGKIIHLHPDSAGDANGFSVGVGGTAGAANNFTRVNEVTPDDATSYNAPAVVNQEDLFNVGASGIGGSDTVNLVEVYARYTNIGSADATATVKVEIEKTSGGTISQGPSLTPNTTTWRSSTFNNNQLTKYQDPDNAGWTQTTLDSMQVGYKVTTLGTFVVNVSNVWTLVDYTPATSTPTSNFFPFM